MSVHVNKVGTTVHGNIDLFGHEGQAEMYREFRPQYTNEIVDDVISAVPPEKRGICVDIACGSGQLTKLLAPYFTRTVGVDQSFAQLGATCTSEERIEWKAGSAFSVPIEASSVDLVTVAQALHWLIPYDSFFQEVHRILKPGGHFCAVAYGLPQITGNTVANNIILELYNDILGARIIPGEPGTWWETNRMSLDGHYADVPFPHPSETHRFPRCVSLSLANYINYLKTWSAYRTMLRSGEPDPIPLIREKLIHAFGAESEDDTIEISIPFFTVHFSKPAE